MPTEFNAGSSLGEVNTDHPRWRGIHHLALITDDMDATVRFYHGVLGAQLVATIGNDSFRHYFFEFAPGQTVAFFEYREMILDHLEKPAGVPDPRAIQFDHLSFHLDDEQALERLAVRLAEYGCEATEIVDHDIMRSLYFTDPNGIALEASWWVLDATGRPADYSDTRFFGDHDPVPAVRELAEGGALLSTPVTRLTPDSVPVVDAS